MDAVRAGSVTQSKLRRNLEDRWLPGMSLTTSAGMGAASPGLARATAINRHPGASHFFQAAQFRPKRSPQNGGFKGYADIFDYADSTAASDRC
ncbi:hypothetical protein K3Z84_16680, partial [Pseudomonas aeruginosa]|nr:hypothetical protein [Pseudomonas aeruginosa]